MKWVKLISPSELTEKLDEYESIQTGCKSSNLVNHREKWKNKVHGPVPVPCAVLNKLESNQDTTTYEGSRENVQVNSLRITSVEKVENPFVASAELIPTESVNAKATQDKTISFIKLRN
ncbi:hypothetical protein NPIL_613241 [Nephila pilipes]|uniref:Uncharacterized protein n=1 Tax=Nephila pilipes TaxID=299642 RepID=A0A8X6QZY6_NEPPI|nr:hypothetical protein NPIL_613241 [Nephila pilipes]